MKKQIALEDIRIDGGTQPRSEIDGAIVAEYAEASKAGAEFPPVTVYFDGVNYWLADGFHRYHATRQNGQNSIAAVVEKGTQRDAVLFSVGANAAHGLRRTNADKRRAVLTLLSDKEWRKWSNRKIADKCGVSHNFVSELRNHLSSDDRYQTKTVERNGVVYEMQTAGINGSRLAAPPITEFSEPLYTNVNGNKPFVTHNTGENEWYTPAEYIEAARRVLGGIDLDPASSEIANKTVRAKTYYTKDDDGLEKHWRGRVWMNPPYASELIGGFAKKLASHIEACDIAAAVVLVNNATETAWFARLMECASAVVFPKSRIRFLGPQGNLGAPLQGQAIIYFGDDTAIFLAEFGVFGWGAVICH